MSDPHAAPISVGTPTVPSFTAAMVTGHRPESLTPADAAWSNLALHRTAWRLRSVYATTVGISGLALGADTWWALGCLAAGMDLHTYVPFESQAARWNETDQALWVELRAAATRETVVGAADYDVRMLHARNDAMLDATEQQRGLVVALLQGDATGGGSFSTVQKARAKQLPLLLLDPRQRTVTREGW